MNTDTIKSDAQNNVPVIPNNGNPGTAYNVSNNREEQQEAAVQQDPFAWVQPSAYMQEVKNIIQGQDTLIQQLQQYLNSQEGTTTQEVVPPPVLPEETTWNGR